MTPASILASIQQASSAVAFSTQEFLAIHAMCDRMSIPREVDGQKLSASQRVAFITGAYEALAKHVGKGLGRPPETTQ